MYPPSRSRERGLKGLLFLCMAVGLFGCWVLYTNPDALTHGPQLIPQLLSNWNPKPAQAAQRGAGVADGVLQGAPSLTPAFIEQVLRLAHSPAQGTGQALYDLSQQYGIDDAYALAFFREESQYGTTGIARFTKSLGNIRCSAGYRCQAGYRSYTTYASGYADWYHLIATLYIGQWHLNTVQQVIPRYAPASDGNNPDAYIASVLQAVSMWRRGDVAG